MTANDIHEIESEEVAVYDGMTLISTDDARKLIENAIEFMELLHASIRQSVGVEIAKLRLPDAQPIYMLTIVPFRDYHPSFPEAAAEWEARYASIDTHYQITDNEEAALDAMASFYSDLST